MNCKSLGLYKASNVSDVDSWLGERQRRVVHVDFHRFRKPAATLDIAAVPYWPVNRIAHYALSAAALAKARTVDETHLQNAIDELQL